ncbi:2-dehydropantoate 2-reductase [Marinobacterium litorale]|uniref:2-dehydropantoate 2-reductase n=1 Tax=Marinobacterium litorale TaxID=404770 RepID=UPI000414256E|nr:2-dehydropantoate 2-reductase [Marinobacterium litorale]
MKVCIYGAGAIGGLLGARLAAAGHSVSVVARGESMEAIQRQGLGLVVADEARFYPVAVAADPVQLGEQDLVVIAVKQPSLNAILPQIKPLLGPETRVLMAMNGVPWWFFDGLPDAPLDPVLRTVDPEGTLRDCLASERIIGCVIHIAASISSPGVSRLNMGNSLILGDALGGCSALTRQWAQHLSAAGFDTTCSESIQRDIWFKLWGNMTMNPVSALTGATTDRILSDPLVRAFCSRAMVEAAQIGSKFGCAIEQTPEERHAGTLALGAMRTSMLQDLEAGRGLEYEALIGVVHEIADKLAVECPNIDAIYGMIRLLAEKN